MADQTESQTLLEPSPKTIETSPSLANPADGPASTTDSVTAYNALPLTHSKSTRVLKILPSESDQTDTIHVKLKTISLDDDPAPEFCALSYVWGNPSEIRHIMVNKEPFPVRRNLWNFLDLMRRREFSDLLWIDAICINQDCIPERNHQVSVMGDIYKGATRVIAWLGTESELVPSDEKVSDKPEMENLPMEKYFDAPLFDSMRLILDDPSMTPDNFQHLDERIELRGLFLQKMLELSYAEYWSRIWIVQEYTLARDVTLLTDRSQMNGQEFFNNYWDYSLQGKAISLWLYPLFRSHEIDLGTSLMIQLMQTPACDRSLLDVMFTFQSSKCIDLRDHVYALLSLVRSEDLGYYAIRPDYSKPELLLFMELVYKTMRRRGLDRKLDYYPRLFAKVFRIEEKFAEELLDKIEAKVRLDIESGRESWDDKVADEIAQLTLAVEQSHRVKESANDIIQHFARSDWRLKADNLIGSNPSKLLGGQSDLTKCCTTPC